MQVDELKSSAKAGFRWSFLRQVVGQVLNLAFGIVLARLLLPADFGDLAVAMILLGFLGIFKGLGLGNAFIYEPKADRSVFSTAFIVAVLTAVLLAGMILLLAPHWVNWMDADAVVVQVLCWLTVEFLLSGIYFIPYYYLIRNFNFRRLFWIDTTAVLLSGVVAVIIAWQGGGVWALVVRMILLSSLKLLLVLDVLYQRLRLGFSTAIVQKLFSFSLPTLGDSSLSYVVRNFDDFLIGKFLGDKALGLYNRSYALLLLPVRQVSGVFSSVLFPALSRLERSEDRVLIYSQVIRTVAFISFPAMIGCGVLREPLVIAVLGEQWVEMVPLIGVFSVLGALQSLATLNGSVFLATGATRLQLKLGLVTKGFVLLALWLGLSYGLIGIAIAYALSSILIMIPEFYYTARLLEIDPFKLLQRPARSLLVALIMGGLVFGLDQYLASHSANYWQRLFWGTGLGVGSYFAIQYFLFPQEVTNFLNIVRKQLSGKA
ncbi:MAG: lipopolysaccharide biosynthesis protein [Bacteroidota bacterium]